MNSLFLSSFFWLERVKHLQIFDRIGFNILKHELYRVQKKSLVFETLYIYVLESNIFCIKNCSELYFDRMSTQSISNHHRSSYKNILASVGDQLAYFVARTMQSQKENPLRYFMAKKKDMTNLSSRLQENPPLSV